MRNLDILVLSDVHLGTYGSRADELLRYLNSISPQRVILNGDLIDFWQFKPNFWPASHMAVIQHLLGWAQAGVQVDYICGNHDEIMRRFVGYTQGKLSILNDIYLEQNGKKLWLTHGDCFDDSMKNKRLAQWGGRWYDRSIRANDLLNRVLGKFGIRPLQISKSLKDGVKRMVNKKHNWEEKAANAALAGGFDMLVVGHIHKPEMREITTQNGSLLYLNSGDWMENLTSLEYHEGRWTLYAYDESKLDELPARPQVPVNSFKLDEAFVKMLSELGVQTA